jgi:hypothetical protein
MKTYLKPILQAVTTSSLINSIDLDETLQFTTVNGSQDRAISLQIVEYGECDFERKSDWMRFVNKLENYDTTPLKRLIVGKGKKLDYGDFTISLTDIEYSDDGFLVEFKKPFPMVLTEVGENYLIGEVSKLKGAITWEWYYRKSHDLDVAGICEIFMHDVVILE